MGGRHGGDPGDDTRAPAVPADRAALLEALTLERFGPPPLREWEPPAAVLEARRRAPIEAIGEEERDAATGNADT